MVSLISKWGYWCGTRDRIDTPNRSGIMEHSMRALLHLNVPLLLAPREDYYYPPSQLLFFLTLICYSQFQCSMHGGIFSSSMHRPSYRQLNETISKKKMKWVINERNKNPKNWTHVMKIYKSHSLTMTPKTFTSQGCHSKRVVYSAVYWAQ